MYCWLSSAVQANPRHRDAGTVSLYSHALQAQHVQGTTGKLDANRINHNLCEPGASESNGIMESIVKIVLGDIGTKLLTGGAPMCFQLFGASHYCMTRNIECGGWKRLHGKDFPGLRIHGFQFIQEDILGHRLGGLSRM